MECIKTVLACWPLNLIILSTKKKLENYTIVKVCFKHFFTFILIWLMFISLFWLFKLFFFWKWYDPLRGYFIRTGLRNPLANEQLLTLSVCLHVAVLIDWEYFFSVLFYNKSLNSRSIILSMWNLNHINNYKLFLFYSFTDPVKN